jgi:predicted porin
MKKSLSLIVSAAVAQAITGNAMAEGPIDGKVYGKINTAIVMEDNAGAEDTYMVNNASRLGFKGKTDLENGLSAVYQLEYEIAPDESAADDGGSGIFKQRNAFVGLAHEKFGTVLAGSHDTPLKLAQGKVDMFNDLKHGDMKDLFHGEIRGNDVLAYASPSFSGVSLMAAQVVGEGGGDANSISLTFKNDALYASVAMDKDIEGTGTETTRVAAQYKIADATIGALMNSHDDGTTSKDGYLVSASYKMDAFTLKGQFGSGDEKSAGREMSAFGVDYKLGKQTKVYIYTVSQKDDGTRDISATGAGMEHKF